MKYQDAGSSEFKYGVRQLGPTGYLPTKWFATKDEQIAFYFSIPGPVQRAELYEYLELDKKV